MTAEHKFAFTSFFLSSRRRHTRWPRDWSSDVCSSDLQGGVDVVRFRNTAEDTADVLIGCRAVQTATVGWLFGVLVVLVRHRSSLLLMGYVFFSTPIIKRIQRSKYIRDLP